MKQVEFGRFGFHQGWHEAAKDATVILKPHLKPRLSPRGKENMELQRQLEEQRGLMHKIKRKQDTSGLGLGTVRLLYSDPMWSRKF